MDMSSELINFIETKIRQSLTDYDLKIQAQFKDVFARISALGTSPSTNQISTPKQEPEKPRPKNLEIKIDHKNPSVNSSAPVPVPVKTRNQLKQSTQLTQVTPPEKIQRNPQRKHTQQLNQSMIVQSDPIVERKVNTPMGVSSKTSKFSAIQADQKKAALQAKIKEKQTINPPTHVKDKSLQLKKDSVFMKYSQSTQELPKNMELMNKTFDLSTQMYQDEQFNESVPNILLSNLKLEQINFENDVNLLDEELEKKLSSEVQMQSQTQHASADEKEQLVKRVSEWVGDLQNTDKIMIPQRDNLDLETKKEIKNVLQQTSRNLVSLITSLKPFAKDNKLRTEIVFSQETKEALSKSINREYLCSLTEQEHQSEEVANIFFIIFQILNIPVASNDWKCIKEQLQKHQIYLQQIIDKYPSTVQDVPHDPQLSTLTRFIKEFGISMGLIDNETPERQNFLQKKILILQRKLSQIYEIISSLEIKS